MSIVSQLIYMASVLCIMFGNSINMLSGFVFFYRDLHGFVSGEIKLYNVRCLEMQTFKHGRTLYQFCIKLYRFYPSQVVFILLHENGRIL